MKNANKSLREIYKVIYYNPGIAKPEISPILEMSLPAISEYVNRLLEMDLVRISEKGTSQGGRKPLLYEINPEYRYILGIDIRKHFFYLFVSDLYANILDNTLIYMKDFDFYSYLSELEESIKKFLYKNSLSMNQILSIGVSITGITDMKNKHIEYSRQLNWKDVPFSYELERRFSLPVFIETDARVFAYNEIESKDPYNVVIVIFLTKGLGVSFIIDNKIFKGYTNRAGDIRFFGEELKTLMGVINKHKIISQISDLPYYAEKFEPDMIKALNKEFFKYLSNDIEQFISEFARFSEALINIINPKKLVLTGNIFDLNDYIYKGVRERIKNSLNISFCPQIKRSNYNEHPLERGIVSMIMNKFFEGNFDLKLKSGGVL